MATQTQKQISVLSLSTMAFTVCFAVWVMFSIIGIPIKTNLGLNETQFGLLAATPILTGSLFRLPLGMLTDKVGGRIVFFMLMISTVIPIWLIRLRNRILAIPGARSLRRCRWLILFGRHCLRCTLVYQDSARALPWASLAPATPEPL